MIDDDNKDDDSIIIVGTKIIYDDKNDGIKILIKNFDFFLIMMIDDDKI